MAGLLGRMLQKGAAGAAGGAGQALQVEHQNKLNMEREEKFMRMKEEIIAKKEEKLRQISKARPVGVPAITKDETGSYFEVPLYDENTQTLSTARTPIGGKLSNRTGETPEEITTREITTAGGKKIAELEAQIESEPELAYQTALKKSQAAAEAALAEKGRSNETAWSVYRSAMDNVSESLGQTSTGTFVGLIPAMTADAKTAEGAISIVAPVLKQIFRTAGEGNFTDKDQQLLLEMVPKRTDPTETREAKIKMIDSVVSAKLGMQPGSGTTLGAPAGAITPTEGFSSIDEEYEALRKRRGL